MFRTMLLRRAYALISKVELIRARAPPGSRLAHLQIHSQPIRSMGQSVRDKKSRSTVDSRESELPDAPPMTSDELDFLEDIVKEGDSKGNASGLENGSDFPEAPPMEPFDLDYDVAEEDDKEPEGEIEAIPFIPPFKKFVGHLGSEPHLLTSSKTSGAVFESGRESQEVQLPDGVKIDPLMEPILAAWSRAIAPTPAVGPMPLHELANRNVKIKELVKLGVDFSKIVDRHGDLERLLHLDWEQQLKPQIRFLVDCGIEPAQLGRIFTRNTPLIWTDKDDIQVRLNYLEVKLFTPDQIKEIINKAAFWLTLPTKELDSRLGFLQRTFKLSGSDVRSVTSSFPTIVSSQRWQTFVDTTKVMDRELGFKLWEQKKLLFSSPQCFLRPSLLRRAFDLCHNEIGLSHNQLVMHAALLVNRENRIKPRFEFLKFLKRDVFNVKDPLYLSPDWLWQGSLEEFCEKAAKTTVEEYENFLKHSLM